MEASKQQVYFIAIRMQAGAIRRELPMIGLGEHASQTVLEAMELVEAQLRDWAAEGMVTVLQLQELLGALMRLPGELRTVKEAGRDDTLSLEILQAFGILPAPGEGEGGGDGAVN
jgi:hypothetical protein